ncbi:hypothetical protein AVEN_27073-1 [Araneus ventricosus]|uniref:Uncharacterized protein n=1 Tax=Araneus ventricosus TaxID=182803 RepID=A0A4Y2K503_ARAVE|nr:hypothetical protein AVEN_27073-1 [Araneus ventricosus]
MEVFRVISNIKNQKAETPHYEGNITQFTSQFQQQSQPTPYHPQPQTFPQPLQQSSTTPSTSYHSQPPHRPPSIPLVATLNAMPIPPYQPRQNRTTFTTQSSYLSTPSLLPHQDPSPSLSTKKKMKETTAAEHYEHFAKYIAEEDCERCSSINSNDSSSTMDANF